jgi:hypothetical protein
MSNLIVLFNLHADADPEAYEQWAKSTDLPVVRELASVSRFDVYRSQSLFGSAEPAPYQYVEVIDIDDLQRFGDEVSGETMRQVAAEFQGFADKPVFILAEKFS